MNVCVCLVVLSLKPPMVGAKWGPSGGILPARELLLVSQEISPGEGARVPAGPHIRGAAKERDTDRHTGPSVCCLTIIGPLFLGTYTEIERERLGAGNQGVAPCLLLLPLLLDPAARQPEKEISPETSRLAGPVRAHGAAIACDFEP